MLIKKSLKIIIVFIIFTSIFFGLTINYSLSNYRREYQNAVVAGDVAYQVFERRNLAEQYLENPSTRIKQQWFLKQEALRKTVNDNQLNINNDEEKILINQIEQKFGESEQIFNQIINLTEESHSSTSAELIEKKLILSGQLGLKAQETISAAKRFEDFNNQSASKSLNQVVYLFSFLASLFFLILLGCFGIIWNSASKLEKIDKMKSDFVSLVSHQLKTPVGIIRGYVSNMLAGITGP